MTQSAQGPTIDPRTYLGASRAAPIFGVDLYGRTQLDVWAETLGVVENDTRLSTDVGPMEIGNELERPVLRLYCRRLGIAFERLTFPGTLRHSLYPEIGATPDAVRGESRIVQVKVVGSYMAHEWGADGDPDGVPPGVQVQVQHELAVTSADVVDVVALFGTDLRVYPIERNQEMIRGMLDVERAWWARHIVGGEMPPAVANDVDTLRRIFKREQKGMRAATPEEAALVEELIRRKAVAAETEEHVEATKAELLAAIADAEGLTLDFDAKMKQRVVSYRANKTGGTDWKGLALTLRQLVEERGIAADRKLLERIESDHERPGPRVLRLPKAKT